MWHHHTVHKLVNVLEPQKKWGLDNPRGVYVCIYEYVCVHKQTPVWVVCVCVYAQRQKQTGSGLPWWCSG